MKIITVDSHTKQFERAHTAVIAYLGGSDLLVKNPNPFTELKRGWEELHNVSVLGNARAWARLEFPNEEEYLMWMMRWS